MKVDLLDIMAIADAQGASDVHIAPKRRPALRIHGELVRLTDYETLTADDTEQMLYGILRDDQRLDLDKTWEIDFSYELHFKEHSVRFRVNIFRQKRGLAAVFRLIPDHILTPKQIGLEEVLVRLTELPRGLVLVTGPTGSGKSTTLATMIDLINAKRKEHILTIEDPIEFVHPEKNCVVSQRELNAHTHSFAAALRSALREDPDVILVGEMRDLETIQLALTAAETGHLVFATLHTTDAPQTIDRIIDVFPPNQQAMVRTQLGGVLAAVVCQTLLRKQAEKGRVAAREIMLATPAIGNHIREGKTHLIAGEIAQGITMGMCPLELALARLVLSNTITLESALEKANRPAILMTYVEGGGVVTGDSNAKIQPPPPAPEPQPDRKTNLWGK